MSCCSGCAKNQPCDGTRMGFMPATVPNFEGFPKYPYHTMPPAPFGSQYPTTYDMGHRHMVNIPNSAFGAVGPNFRRNVHMVAEAFGVVVAAPMVWWAASQTSDPRARAMLRGLAITMAATDAALLASYLWEMYRGSK